MGIGASALIASLMNTVAPKAVHAAAAALVQVVNTTAAPALTQDVSRSGALHVELKCYGPPTDPPICQSYYGTTGVAYSVPSGRNLVVTSVDVIAPTGGAIGQFQLAPPGFGIWNVPSDGLTHSFQYPSGIVFENLYTFDKSNVSLSASYSAILNGFLTSN